MESRFDTAALPITKLRAPPGLSALDALSRLRALAPGATVDRNHLYRPSSEPGGPFVPAAMIAWSTAGCAEPPLMGMIDTGINKTEPSLARSGITTITQRGATLPASGRAHGTAVAVLLVGQGSGASAGLVPRARLVAIDAFHRHERADAADAFDLASAILLLNEQRVRVANLSVVGPANDAVARAGALAAARGMLIVAAAGNDGANAPPRYPAAYGWAIAATAVDRAGQPYARAGRGAHIAFAAPGVALPIMLGGRQVQRSGTSFAAPFVTAAIALALSADPRLDTAGAMARVTGQARDLGPPGRDQVFGWGLVQGTGLCRRGFDTPDSSPQGQGG